jgi:hypothetical protein
MFKHLQEVRQGYFEHFLNAMSYCLLSLTASFYFFIHAIWPDAFEFNGSRQILYLSELLNNNHKNMNV